MYLRFAEWMPVGFHVLALFFIGRGAMTLRGTSRSVTFDVQGTFKNGLIGVLGQIPVVFDDYGIPNPSTGTVTTEDNGVLEFVLVLQKT